MPRSTGYVVLAIVWGGGYAAHRGRGDLPMHRHVVGGLLELTAHDCSGNK
jgi:hypothetical protein